MQLFSHMMPKAVFGLQGQGPNAPCESLLTAQLCLGGHPAPGPRTRAVRKRGKMLQSLQKASAKSEAILLKLVECGKLQPGSIDRVRVCPPLLPS